MFDETGAAGAFEPVGAIESIGPVEPAAETGEGVGTPLGRGEGEGARRASSIAALTDA